MKIRKPLRTKNAFTAISDDTKEATDCSASWPESS